MLASILILILTGVNTALSTRVNYFQDFFFVADKFPLIMSVVTMVLYSFIILLDYVSENAFVARPPFYLAVEAVLSIFWLAFNAFSTSRWRHIPLECNEIPREFEDERAWCRDLQALKSFVWVEWLFIFLSFAFTLRFVLTHHAQGRRHIWRTALSRYYRASPIKHTSEFLQYVPGSDPFSTHADADATYYANGAYFAGAQPVRTVSEAGMRQAYDQRQAPPSQAAYGNVGQNAAVPAIAVSDYDAPPKQWVQFPDGQRDSTAGGPGLAGIGVGPGTPARWGGFERM